MLSLTSMERGAAGGHAHLYSPNGQTSSSSMAHVRTHGGSAAGLPYAEAERGLPDRTEFAVCSPPSHVSVCNLTALRGKTGGPAQEHTLRYRSRAVWF